MLHLLLESVGERRIKLTSYIPLIPALSLKGKDADAYLDTYALGEEEGESILENASYDQLCTCNMNWIEQDCQLCCFDLPVRVNLSAF